MGGRVSAQHRDDSPVHRDGGALRRPFPPRVLRCLARQPPAAPTPRLIRGYPVLIRPRVGPVNYRGGHDRQGPDRPLVRTRPLPARGGTRRSRLPPRWYRLALLVELE